MTWLKYTSSLLSRNRSELITKLKKLEKCSIIKKLSSIPTNDFRNHFIYTEIPVDLISSYFPYE